MCHARVWSVDEPVWCCNRLQTIEVRSLIRVCKRREQSIPIRRDRRLLQAPNCPEMQWPRAPRSRRQMLAAPASRRWSFAFRRCENTMRRFPNRCPPFTCSNLLCRPLQRSCTVPLNRIAAALSGELRDLRQHFPSLAVRAECWRIPVAAAPSGARPRGAQSLPHRPGR